MAKKATLFDPKTGKGTVVDAGSAKASELQSKGFTLTPPKATLFSPDGKGRQVLVGSTEASDLQSRGFTLKPKPSSQEKATLIDKEGTKEVVKVGSKRASELQGSGFRLFNGREDQPVTAPPSITGQISDPAEGEELINAGQADDFANKQVEEEPPVRDQTKLSKRISEISKTTRDLSNVFGESVSQTTKAPEVTNLVQLFKDLRSGEQGEVFSTVDLEDQLSTLNKQRRDQVARRTARLEFEEDQPVALGVIGGRTSEIAQQEQKNIQAIDNEIQFIADQLETKTKLIDTIIDLTNTDFKNAKSLYDSQFSQNIQAMNFVKGVQSAQKTEEDKDIDNARANLNIVYNNLADSKINKEDLTNAQKLMITEQEAKAGLPIGYYDHIQAQADNGKIFSTTTRTAPGGNKFATSLIRKADGSIEKVDTFIGKVESKKGDIPVDPDAESDFDFADRLIKENLGKGLTRLEMEIKLRELRKIDKTFKLTDKEIDKALDRAGVKSEETKEEEKQFIDLNFITASIPTNEIESEALIFAGVDPEATKDDLEDLADEAGFQTGFARNVTPTDIKNYKNKLIQDYKQSLMSQVNALRKRGKTDREISDELDF